MEPMGTDYSSGHAHCRAIVAAHPERSYCSAGGLSRFRQGPTARYIARFPSSTRLPDSLIQIEFQGKVPFVRIVKGTPT